MIAKRLDQITADDLEALVREGVPERRGIEYKEALPDRSDASRLEFLRDASSFANAQGGHIVYGIREKRDSGVPTGIPEALVGLGKVNTGATINSLEDIVRSGIEPRMGIEAREVPCKNGPMIVFHVPRSYSAPHMVTRGADNGFYTRSSAGKYRMSADEIRNAFLESDSLGERLRAFRRSRIARILAGETPFRSRRAAGWSCT
jgi:predicted HTH transcriptional regulator